MLYRELGELTVDDCTIEAVSVAASTRVATHQAFEAALRDYFGDTVRAPHQRGPPVQRLVVDSALCHAMASVPRSVLGPPTLLGT